MTTSRLGGSRDRLYWVLEKLELALMALDAPRTSVGRFNAAARDMVALQPTDVPDDLAAAVTAIREAMAQPSLSVIASDVAALRTLVEALRGQVEQRLKLLE